MALTKVSNWMLVQRDKPVNHNVIINPSFTVFQRAGTTLSGDWGVDHDNVIGYGPDRWSIRGIEGSRGTLAQSSTDSTTGINKLVVKHDGATSNGCASQRIETANLLGLYGKEITISFSYSDVGGSGVPEVMLKGWDSKNGGKTLFYDPPTPLGNNRWSKTVTLTTADGTIPDLDKKGLQINIYPNSLGEVPNTSIGPAPNEWSIWEVKLELGAVATPFIDRSPGEELALCQRYYYQRDYNINNYQPIKFPCWNNSVAAMTGEFVHPVPMRANPSVSNNGVGNFRVNTSQGNDEPCIGIQVMGTNKNETFLSFEKSTQDLIIGQCGYISTQENNGAALYFDAEI